MRLAKIVKELKGGANYRITLPTDSNRGLRTLFQITLGFTTDSNCQRLPRWLLHLYDSQASKWVLEALYVLISCLKIVNRS